MMKAALLKCYVYATRGADDGVMHMMSLVETREIVHDVL